jgi:hypothetical protein
MRILIDENMPISFFSEILAGFETKTIKELGWDGIKNGELLSRIEGDFDLFVTGDKNIQFQQNLADRSFAIVEIYTNRLPLLRAIKESIVAEIGNILGNEYKKIGP